MGSPNLFSQFAVDMKGAEVASLTQLTSTQMLGGSKTKQLTVATSSCPGPFYETKNVTGFAKNRNNPARTEIHFIA